MATDRNAGRAEGCGLDVCWVSDRGWTRESNEDACLALPEQGIFIVSDGMGGEHAGGVASSRVIEWLPGIVREHVTAAEVAGGDERVHARLRDALTVLNHRVRDEASHMAGLGRMGATVTVALVRGGRAHVAHMGDSRAYLLRDGELTRLTRDHSVVGMLLERGALTPRQAVGHPMRGRLARYVGMGGNARPDITSIRLREDDLLLFCTDGLTDALSDQRIAGILSRDRSLTHASHDLVSGAQGEGTRDNVTVLLARWQGDSAGGPPAP